MQAPILVDIVNRRSSPHLERRSDRLLPNRVSTFHDSLPALAVMNVRSTEIRKQRAFLLAENTRMNARFTEMSRQISKMSKQRAFLPAENTKMSTRSTEMSKQRGKTSKQMVILLAETTEMGKRMDKMRKQTPILLIESVVKSKRSAPYTPS